MLGGNIGDTEKIFKKSYLEIATKIGVISSYSKIYRTSAWGYKDQEDFLNQALVIRTDLQHRQILSKLFDIETSFGKNKIVENGPRTLDIDIMFFNSEVIYEDDLEVPHPRMHLRRFNLVPLNDLLPEYIHPVLNKSIKTLLEECPDQGDITPLKR